MNKIYAWINEGKGTDWNIVVALADDGRYLCSHVSSNEGWAKDDIGITSERKHEIYNEAFPNGWEIEWVDDPSNHKGLDEAYKLNQMMAHLNSEK